MKLRAPAPTFTLRHAGHTYEATPDWAIEMPEDIAYLFRRLGCTNWVEPRTFEYPIEGYHPFKPVDRIPIPESIGEDGKVIPQPSIRGEGEIITLNPPIEDSIVPSEIGDADEFALMKRNELFAWLKKREVAMKAHMTNEDLQAACRDKIARDDVARVVVEGRTFEYPFGADMGQIMGDTFTAQGPLDHNGVD